MKGMLLKDMISIRRTLVVLLMIVIFALGGDNTFAFALFYTLMLPINLLAMEERSRFDRLMPMLPMTGLQCVLDKYIVTYVGMAIMLAVSVAVQSLRGGALALPAFVLPAMAFTLIGHAVTVPLMIRFGVERGRWIYMLVIIVGAGLLGVFSELVKLELSLDWAGLSAAIFALAVVMNVGSLLLSQKLFEKRAME